MPKSIISLSLGHSPDPDDIFLTYPILSGLVRLEDVDVQFFEVCLDIEILNKLVLADRLDVSAASVPAFLKASRRYYLIRYGASVGYRYGPKIICRGDIFSSRAGEVVVAVPGLNTTARVLAEVFLRRVGLSKYLLVDVPHDKVTYLVKSGVTDCGVVIHEEQLVVENIFSGEFSVYDLGEWWYRETKLPIPLGVNIVSRRIGEDLARKISSLYIRSIRYSLENFDSILNISLKYSRVKNENLVRKFIQMYVKPDPIGEEELKAIRRLYELSSSEKVLSLEEEPELVLV